MTRRNQLSILLGAAALVVLSAAQLQAQTAANAIYWEGGNGNLIDANYTNFTVTDIDPTLDPTYSVFFGGSDGAGVTGTLSGVGTLPLNRLFIGYNDDPAVLPDVTAVDGEGTVTVSGGAQINLTGGATGTLNAGLIVGNVRDGVLNIDGAGSSVTSNRLIVIGIATSQTGRSGKVNVTNGGVLISSEGNIDLGTSDGGAGQNGMQGHLVVSGEGSLVQALGSGADLNIGIRKSTSSVTQSGGLIEIDDDIEVGFGGTSGTIANPNSSFNISGGTTTHGGAFMVGEGASSGAKANISGGTINSTAGNFFVGRGSSTGATVNFSGGTVNTGNRFLMGGGTATGVVVNHSAGTLNTVLDVRVADAFTSATSDATYNLSGTGVINSTTGAFVGRRGIGKFFQTGGEANFMGQVLIGARESEDPLVVSTDGLYQISAGDLNIGGNVFIAPNGVGQLRVVGQDGTIDVAGDITVGNATSTVNGVGTLAYQLEASESLSMISVGDGVTGTATFNSGSSLVLDETNATPGQTSYDLVTAFDIIDNGLLFTGPAGWTHSIVNGGLGEILRVSAPGAVEDADFDADGDVDGADFLTWQRNLQTASPTLAQGDANDDDAVDGDDLAIWEGQFGASTAAAASIPEPGAGVLLLTGLAAAAAWRRRRITR